MKVYNLNIDTSKPVNQVMQMQRNDTGLLSANVTNDGKYIRNLSCTLYDGDNEISATNGGFKVAVGNTTKVVKIEAKSTPIMGEWEDIVSSTPGARIKTFTLKKLELPAGTYKQEEFLPLLAQVEKVTSGVYYITCNQVDTVPTSNVLRIEFNMSGRPGVSFVGLDGHYLTPDEDVVVSEGNYFFFTQSLKANSIEKSVETYPAVGYYTDYQLDTTIRPSANAPYDGEYEEPLTEIEVDGVKFVPTTLTIDGVEYKVLAEEQPTPEPEPEPTPDPEEPVEP